VPTIGATIGATIAQPLARLIRAAVPTVPNASGALMKA
jgi:hypothetical protein